MQGWEYSISRNGEMSGPHLEAELRSLLESGDLGEADLCRVEGREDWITVGEVLAGETAPPPLPAEAPSAAPPAQHPPGPIWPSGHPVAMSPYSCPRCGGRYLRDGPWPWYLGTVGAMLCKAMICLQCGHEFDLKKPEADLAKRKRNLAWGINAAGGLGILLIIVAFALFVLAMQ